VLRRHRDRAPAASSLAGWPLPSGAPFIFATLHRAELVDDPSALATVFPTLAALDLPVVFAAHPRTRGALARAGLLPHDGASPHVLDPLGYLEAIAAVRDARLVITDSGGIQREAYWLGTPCITIRRETEWVETVEREANVLLPAARVAGELIPAVRERLAITREWDRAAYGDGDAAERVADAIARHMGAH
jgi:UDP-N-acetylglucosamine 2-epimerase